MGNTQLPTDGGDDGVDELFALITDKGVHDAILMDPFLQEASGCGFSSFIR